MDAKAAFSFVKGFLPKYFSSEWSLAQYKLPDFTKSIVAFGPEPNTLIVASVEGYVSYFPSYGQSGCRRVLFALTGRITKSALTMSTAVRVHSLDSRGS